MLDERGSTSDDSSDMVAGEASSSRPEERATKCEGGRRPLRVGCALLPKKVSRYLTPKMIRTARAKGVELLQIDYTRPLIDQGPYDAIVHKLRPNLEWERHLQEYVRARPGVKVIDSVAGIRTLQNRATMLSPLKGNGIVVQRPPSPNGACSPLTARVQSPTQVEITEGMSLDEAQGLLQAAGLRPPLLFKPLWTDGREGSHGLAVLHDMAALGRLLEGSVSSELKAPLVVQQFVEHGGVLFKVYVLGLRTVVCRRPSLGDSYLGDEAQRAGVLSLPRISCKSTYAPYRERASTDGTPAADDDLVSVSSGPATAGANSSRSCCPGAGAGTGATRGSISGDGATWGSLSSDTTAGQGGRGAGDPAAGEEGPHRPGDMPPEWVTHGLAGRLRDRLGLQLFNFDLICPEVQESGAERLYYVVDINYFPGVDKIPNFEHIFVDFLTSTCTAEGSAVGGGSASSVAGLGATAPVVGEAGQVVQGSGTEQGGSAGQGQAPGLGDKKEQGAANARGHELGVGAETARGA